MSDPPATQLSLLGIEEAIRQGKAAAASPVERRRIERGWELAQELLLDPPAEDDFAFMHSGLCQTYLPHSRPRSNQQVWTRSAGRFTLIVQPGLIDDRAPQVRGRSPTPEEQERMFVGVPYGARARLILIYLQSEGVQRGREVSLGASLSAWIRSMGLAVQGGERGTISMVREQAMRVARCQFTLQWDGSDGAGQTRRALRDIRLVDGLDLAADDDAKMFPRTVLLNEAFYEHLREHAVPLDRRSIGRLVGNSLGLDLYAMFAYRLPRLKAGLHLSWTQLHAQLGANYKSADQLAKKIKHTLTEVAFAYPEAKVEVTRHGLLLKPSPSSVPRNTSVNGFKLMLGGRAI
ncbi:replication protein RepA [Falsiroseomonas sp. E2-1-a20]|uniref:replication protein RepA n=1 Tax=Falsiroseomonas sp. E2-1-a20 TaxID=3239300 RepID=UPI003F377191